MKVTLAEVKSLEASLGKLFDKDVNIKIAYRLSSLIKKLSEELSILEENRIKLVKQYGVEDEKTKAVSVPPDKSQDFYNAFNELMQIEIEIDFEPIPLKDLGEIELSASDMMKLDGKIIKGPEEVKKPIKKEKE